MGNRGESAYVEKFRERSSKMLRWNAKC